MIRINDISDNDYIVIDAILVILNNITNLKIASLQYELLKCGLYIGQPTLREVIRKIHDEGLVDFATMDFDFTQN